MADFSGLGRELDELLRLRTPSLGIKFFKRISDLPQEFEKVQTEVMVCQVLFRADT